MRIFQKNINFINMEIIITILSSVILSLYISNGILDIEMKNLTKKKEF